jgi:hypothetical protein
MHETKKKSQTTSTKMSLDQNEELWETLIPAMAGYFEAEVLSNLPAETTTRRSEKVWECQPKKLLDM